MRRQVSRAARSYIETRVSLACLRGAPGGRATRLLVRTLETRLEQVIQGLFAMLGLRYPPHDINAAWRAIRRGTPAEMANAAEFLDNILDHDLKRFVLPLLDGDRPPEQIGRELFGIELYGAAGALRAMIEDGDSWLAACAMAAAAELGFRDLAPVIRDAVQRAGREAVRVAEASLRALGEKGLESD